MDPSSIDSLPPDRLAHLLDPHAAGTWSDADAAAALAQQLHTPLLPDLLTTPGIDALVAASADTQAASPHTFLQALTATPPNIDLLQAIKAWAKRIRDQPAHPLAPGPATVLYYAALAAAHRAGTSITTLTPDQLHAGIGWSQQQPGAQPLTHLFTAALAHQ